MLKNVKRWSMVIAMAAGFALAGPLRAGGHTRLLRPRPTPPSPRRHRRRNRPPRRRPRRRWVKRHKQLQVAQIARRERSSVLFVGDSITDGWRGGGKEVFEQDLRRRSTRSTSASAATAPSTSSGGSRTARSTASSPRSPC